MSIQGIANAGTKSVDWEKVLSSLGDVQKTTGADGKEAFTITMNTDGTTRTTSISIPDDLEIPEEVTAESLSALVSKLVSSSGLNLSAAQISQMKDEITALFNETAKSMNEVSASSSNKKSTTMYDIYALMALMVDIAQTQRNATREMRTAENLAVQKSIQDQADLQHTAASIGMWVGIATGALSAGISAGVMVAQGVSATQQNKLVSQSGAESAKMHAEMLQNTDTKVNSQNQLQKTMNKVGDRVATDVAAKFEDAIRNSSSGDLRGNLGEAMHKRDVAAAKLETAKNELTAAQQENIDALTATRDQLQARYNELGGDDTLNASLNKQKYIVSEKNAGRQPNEETLASYDAKIARHEEIKSVKAQLDAANQELNAASNNIQTKQGNVRIAQEELKTAETNLDKARDDYQKTISGVAEGYRQEYQSAVDRLSNPPEGTTRAQLEADVKTAKANMEMAFALEADMLASDGVMSPAQRQDLLATARAKSDYAMDSAYKRSDVKALDRRMTTLQGIANINQGIGGVLQSMTQNMSSMVSADATRQGSETTKQEEMLDQTKDLFSQEQNVIDHVISLCQSVIQTENQSMRDAIQA